MTLATSTDRFAMIELDPMPAALAVTESTARMASVEIAPAPVETVTVHTTEANGSAIGSNGALSARASGMVTSARSLAVAADLNWNPEIVPLIAAGVELPASMGRAVIRNDTKATIGIVGARYTAFPHLPMFDLVDMLAGASGGILKATNAGHKKGGALPFVQMACERNSPIGPVMSNLSIFSSHDGTLCLTLGMSETVIVCRNTYAHALSDCATGLKIKHTSQGAEMLAQVERIADLTCERATAWDNATLRMLATPFSDAQAIGLARKLIPGDSKRSENMRTQFMDAYASAPGAAPGNVWGAAQAVTYVTSHYLGTVEGREETAIFGTGTGADFQRSAFDLFADESALARLSVRA